LVREPILGLETKRDMAAAVTNPARNLEDLFVPPALTLEMYRKLLTVFYIEERMKALVKQGKCSFQASTRGHEKLQIAMTMLLKPGHDWFFTYYRSKAIAVGLGMPLKDIFLGMLSREGDPNSNGRNMSEHWSSRPLHLVSQTAVTGTQYLNAVGMARAIRAAGGDEIVHVSSGDGATSEGEFFEALNWAQREKLPVLFLVQNNGFAISTRQSHQTGSSIYDIARGFGLAAFRMDGTSFDSIYETVPPIVQSIRSGEGPALIEASVVRIDPHSSSDDHRKYRDESDLQAVNRRDPLLRTEQYVLAHNLLTPSGVEALRAEVRAAVDLAAEEVAAQPEPSADGLMTHIYAADPVVLGTPAAPTYVSSEPVAMIDAINHGLREELERDSRIVMWGEDIADPKGGVFGVTRGLSARFPERVFNAPLAEASIAGVAAGMAMGGYKPIVEIQFGDYLWPAAMQLRNEIPTVRWRSQGESQCPVVLRVAAGGYIKGGPWHSACVESFFSHIPGWLRRIPEQRGRRERTHQGGGAGAGPGRVSGTQGPVPQSPGPDTGARLRLHPPLRTRASCSRRHGCHHRHLGRDGVSCARTGASDDRRRTFARDPRSPDTGAAGRGPHLPQCPQDQPADRAARR
jgi:2-oxoisovalerate dehydrogenase E1 component